MKDDSGVVDRLFPDDETLRRLRDLFSSASYTEDGILEHLRQPVSMRFGYQEIPWLLRLTHRKTPLDILIRLFLCNQQVDARLVNAALAPLSVDSLCKIGLLRCDSKGVKSLLRLIPARGLIVGFDALAPTIGKPQKSDHVHGVGVSSITLCNATVRKPCQSVLDLGTGSGIQAMMCASHSDRVIATDVNSRALTMARFNAALNGLANISFTPGYGFDPVRDHRFDLIVMNPPYVISPEVTFVFRDAGMTGDNFVRQLCMDAPAHLSEGGMCQVMAQWAHMQGQPVQDRLQEWAGKGCDAWFLTLTTQTKENYVSSWLAETEAHGPDSLNRRWEAWMRYLDELGIERISTGVINLRRSGSAAPWFWVNDDAKTIDAEGGDAIYRGFQLWDYLNESSDEKILDTAFTISPSARLDQSSQSVGAGWAPKAILLRQTRGIHYVGNIDNLMAGVLGQCNGQRPLIRLIDDLVQTLHAERTSVVDSVLAVAKELIQRGFLLPPGKCMFSGYRKVKESPVPQGLL